MSNNNVTLLKSFIDYCSDKGKVLNQNIANVNSENYKRRNVDFSTYLNSQLQSNMNSENPKHLTTGNNTGADQDGIFIEDANVDIETEMAELAKNTLNFKFATKKVGSYYKTLQEIIKSGG